MLTDLFCSKELDTLRIVQCGISSLNGIDISNKMQCLYLHYNRHTMLNHKARRALQG